MPINQPSNQIKLTNVAIVRHKKGKKRFEIACYKNKVLEYRSGTETDLDEVLQTDQVFTNVSKGALAPKADLAKAFGASTPVPEIIEEILRKGELQVGEKERGAKMEALHNEVIGMVASRCVDPETTRVYTPTMIDKALQEISSKKETPEGEPEWRGVRENKNAKALALEAIKALVRWQIIPIARARMRCRIVGNKKCKEKVLEAVEEVGEEEFKGAEWECVVFVEPGKYKQIVELVGQETKGRGRVDILDTAVIHESEN